MKRGEVWLVRFDPAVGNEIRKTRPGLILSPPVMGRLGTVLLAPMTTGSRPAPYRVAVRFDGKDGLIVLDQLRGIDRSRLVRHLGILNDETLVQTLATAQAIFTL